MVYTAVPATVGDVRLTSCVMEVPLPADAPVTPLCATVHANVVLPRLLERLIDVALPLHRACDAGVAVATGNGFTVMVTEAGVADEQELADGVIVYTTVPGVRPVVDNVWLIELPPPDVAPLASVCVAVQVKVVPATLLVSPMDVAEPEQIVWLAGVVVTSGIGFTVMVTVVVVPAQPVAARQ